MRNLVLSCFILAASAAAAVAQIEGDIKRGGQIYRSCVACHSLRPGVHLSGPSLADLWGKKAGSIETFKRYSDGLRKSDFVWDENTLNAWLADPSAMVPDTYMTFRGIQADSARTDLIAFLQVALAPGGAAEAVSKGLIDERFAGGQLPEALDKAGADQQVTAIRRCADTYFVKTKDGREQPYWEMNVRFKTDTSERGSKGEKPVLAYAGMQGDRISIVFKSAEAIAQFIKPDCSSANLKKEAKEQAK